MEIELLENLGQIAGIGGIALGVFLLLFKQLLEKIDVPGLTKAHWFKVIITFMILVWSIAIIGIGAWAYSYYLNESQKSTTRSTDPVSGKEIDTIGINNLDIASTFIGEWINVDKKTRSVTRFILKKSGDKFFINTWGSCSPSDCAWGEVSVDVFTKDVSSNSKTDGIVLGIDRVRLD